MSDPASRTTPRTFGFVNWTLRPDLDDDAPPTLHSFRCLTLTENDTACAAASEPSADPAEQQSWAFDHMRRNPEHTSYAEVIERPWVMWRHQGPA
ncbi:DUF7848 domain-containing protein [Streptomyces beihaiensis]|uniref:DUF7848 domain-containing protein n=1 Tax=Streptomyces beihaiensis TaxID=2984495 RepID=A0ABT3TXJ8_9ACTN|nr:hypothetical protein [Streptomyces beihaiensis]MCX3061530.1 hypothetical protein [Streptomyces beihaiensis]